MGIFTPLPYLQGVNEAHSARGITRMEAIVHTQKWAHDLITNPERANALGRDHCRRAWFTLMAARGHYCRYPAFPEPKLNTDDTRTVA